MSKEITITIKPPITERCSKCGYENSGSFYSHPVKCPKCGKNSIQSVSSPRTTSIRVYSSKGSYNWANPSEKQYSYTFYNLPDGFQRGYVVDDELDTSCPLDCARELKEIINNYLYSGNMKKINELVEYLESVEEEQYELQKKEKREKLEFELYKLLS